MKRVIGLTGRGEIWDAAQGRYKKLERYDRLISNFRTKNQRMRLGPSPLGTIEIASKSEL